MKDMRDKDIKLVTSKDAQGNLHKKMSKYGTAIDKIYPLVNPDLDKEQRLEQHQNWFEDSTKAKAFLTQGGADNEKFVAMTPNELSLQSPCILEFLPGKKTFKKLIKRAT